MLKEYLDSMINSKEVKPEKQLKMNDSIRVSQKEQIVSYNNSFKDEEENEVAPLPSQKECFTRTITNAQLIVKRPFSTSISQNRSSTSLMNKLRPISVVAKAHKKAGLPDCFLEDVSRSTKNSNQ